MHPSAIKKKKKSNVDCLSAFQLKEREKEGGGGKCIHMHLSAWESERNCRFIPFCVYCWAFFSRQCLWPNFDQILIYMLMVKIWQGHWLNVNIWNQFLNNNCFKTKLRITAIWLPHQVSKHTNQPLKLKQEYISNFTTIFICLYERLTARGLENGHSVFEVQYILTSPNCPSTCFSHGHISQFSLQL